MICSRISSNDSYIQRYPEGRNAFHTVIKDFIANGTPYDAFVTKLLSASGSTWSEGAGNWAVGGSTPMGPVQDTYDTLAVRAATQFLGLGNLDCVLCHSGAGHLDKLNVWATGVQRRATRRREMAAFFARFRMQRSPQQNGTNVVYWTVSDVQTGDYTLNTTAGNRTPRQPFSGSNLIRPKSTCSPAPRLQAVPTVRCSRTTWYGIGSLRALPRTTSGSR